VALTWNLSSRGWAALLPEGRHLYLRLFDPELNLVGDRRLVWQAAPSAHTAALVPWRGGLVAAHAPAGGGDVQVQRITPSTVYDPVQAGVRATGDVALVAWDDDRAALVVEDAAGTALVRLDADGLPLGVSRCGAAVVARAVVPYEDGYVGAEVLRDADEGESGIDLVRLDARCAVQQRTNLWRGPVNGRAVSLVSDETGTVAVWSDRASRAWVGATRHDGSLATRPAVLDSGVRDTLVFARRDARGRRLGLRVLALRSNEVYDRALVYELTDAGTLRDTAGIGEARSLAWQVRAVDPWGGAVAVWTLPDPTAGATLHRDATLGAMVRVCP